MAGINHAFTSAKADSADTTLVRPSNWNADHTITGNVDFNAFNAINVGQVTLTGGGAFKTNAVLYTQITDSTGNGAVWVGNTSDPGNYYDNTAHIFRGRTGSGVTYAVLNASSLAPGANDLIPLGTGSTSWSDLFLASGGVINWANSECTLYEPAQGSIAISADPNNAIAASGIQFIIDGTVTGLMASAAFRPQSNDGWALGNSSIGWSDLFLADGGVVNWGGGGVTATHTAASDSFTFSLDAANALASTQFSISIDNAAAMTLMTTLPDGSFGDLFEVGSADYAGVMIKGTNASGAGQQVQVLNASPSPAANDTICQFVFDGYDSGLNTTAYASIITASPDVTDGSEDGRLTFRIISGGAVLNALQIGFAGTGSTFTHIFDVGSGSSSGIDFKSTNAGQTGPRLTFYHNSASPAASDIPGITYYYGKDSGAADQLYGYQYMQIDDATAGSEDASHVWNTVIAGTDTQVLLVRGGTTASAANAFIDNAAGNELKRSTSAGRYKRDVEPLDAPSVSDRLARLRPVCYRSAIETDPQDTEFYGLIAEEVAAVDPKLVHFIGADRDIPDGVQYDRLPVLLLSALIEQERRISELEERLANVVH